MSPYTRPHSLLATLSALLALAAPLAAQEAPALAPAANFTPGRPIDLRPQDKRPLLLKESERNPYARRNPDENPETQEENSPEELRIRQRLSGLRVTGRSRSDVGLRVLLGDIILEEGRDLPQLIPNQSEALRVVSIDEDSVVLGWVDPETREFTGKTMQVAYDLSPSVGYALHGQSREDAQGNAADRRMGLIRFGAAREAEAASAPPNQRRSPGAVKNSPPDRSAAATPPAR